MKVCATITILVGTEEGKVVCEVRRGTVSGSPFVQAMTRAFADGFKKICKDWTSKVNELAAQYGKPKE